MSLYSQECLGLCIKFYKDDIEINLEIKINKYFINCIDIANRIKEIKQNIEYIQIDINNIDKEINYLQKQIRTANSEDKKQIIIKLKNLGLQKNNLISQTNKLLEPINSVDGLKDQLVRKIPRIYNSKNDIFNIIKKKYNILCHEFIINYIIQNSNVQQLFIKLIHLNYNKSSTYGEQYLSVYAKNIAKNVRLEERNGNIFRRLCKLNSFHSRNLLVAQEAMQEGLINYTICSFMKQC